MGVGSFRVRAKRYGGPAGALAKAGRSWKLTLLVVFATALASLQAHVRISTKVSWEREVGPIVQARCVTCHRDGGRAPMSLATYEEARPWAKAIKEEVLARRMPKWHVVRGYGDFSNDPSLSAFEVALIASWADGGAPASAKGLQSGTSTTALTQPTASARPSKTRTVTTLCSSPTLPAGRLLAVKPALDKGASLRLDLTRADGTEEPLIWLKDFDPAFAETYWLRTPINVSRRTRLVADTPSCTIVLTYAG